MVLNSPDPRSATRIPKIAPITTGKIDTLFRLQMRRPKTAINNAEATTIEMISWILLSK
jgi:hypothetical protein